MGSVLGTPAFMSPEQALGQLENLGAPTDVYSLGATLYCVLTGQAPCHGEKDIGRLLLRVVRGEIPPPRQVNAKAPAALDAICMKAMAVDIKDRYASARALAEDVERWLADEPVSAWKEPLTVRARRWTRRHRVLVSGAAAALLVGLISLVGANVILADRNQMLAEANETISKREKEARDANADLVIANDKVRSEKQAADAARFKETAAREDAEDQLATTTMMLAKTRFEESSLALADDILEQVEAKYRR